VRHSKGYENSTTKSPVLSPRPLLHRREIGQASARSDEERFTRGRLKVSYDPMWEADKKEVLQMEGGKEL